MGIRSKILAGVVVIGSMLFFSGAIAIYELKVLGKSMQSLVESNMRSIGASRSMLKASSKISDGVLNIMSGNWNKGKMLVREGKQTYTSSLRPAVENVANDSERLLLQNVGKSYSKYISLIDTVLTASVPKDLAWYCNTLVPAETSLRNDIGELITINQNALYDSTALMEKGAYKAFVPGIITIIAGLIFVILFYAFLMHYFVDPMLKITHGVENFVKHAMPFRVKIETKDEIGQLGKSIEKLIQMDRNNKIVD